MKHSAKSVSVSEQNQGGRIFLRFLRFLRAVKEKFLTLQKIFENFKYHE